MSTIISAGQGTQTSTPATTQIGAQANQTVMNQFLTLLTTELKNQDPTQPTDPTQFVTQLAQMSNVEQVTQSNSTLSTIASTLGGMALGQYSAMIGHTVTAPASAVTVPSSGTVATPLTFNVTASGVTTPYVAVSNAAGNVVATLPVSGSTGTVTFTGVGQNGQALPAGQYSVSLVGKPVGGALGSTISAGTLTTTDVVGSVSQGSNGGWNLQLKSGQVVPASSVTSSS